MPPLGRFQVSLPMQYPENPFVQGINAYGQIPPYQQDYQGIQRPEYTQRENHAVSSTVYSESTTHSPTFNVDLFGFGVKGANVSETATTSLGTAPSTPSASPGTSPPLLSPPMSACHNFDPTSGVSPQQVFSGLFAGTSSSSHLSSMSQPQGLGILHPMQMTQASYSTDQPQHHPILSPPLYPQRSFSAGSIYGPPANSSMVPVYRAAEEARAVDGSGIASLQFPPQHVWPINTGTGHAPLQGGSQTQQNDWRSVAIDQQRMIARQLQRQNHHPIRNSTRIDKTRMHRPQTVSQSRHPCLRTPHNDAPPVPAYNLQQPRPISGLGTVRRSSEHLPLRPDSDTPKTGLESNALKLSDVPRTPPPAYSTAGPPPYSTATARRNFPSIDEPKPRSSLTRRNCRYCNKGFTRPANLRSHEDVHLGVRRHGCKGTIGELGCGLYFTRLTDLKRHCKAKHPRAIWPFEKKKKGHGEIKTTIKIEEAEKQVQSVEPQSETKSSSDNMGQKEEEEEEDEEDEEDDEDDDETDELEEEGNE
ncbi:MAG: hypothetical protein J3Q66DRAFT_436346 [Benniella sp.]|nr:MAG: hypothetical protein J3Q66DRAFT_436346 [Benniella sp.]